MKWLALLGDFFSERIPQRIPRPYFALRSTLCCNGKKVIHSSLGEREINTTIPIMSRVCHFKLVLLGDTAVGKSCLVVRFVRDEFFEFQEPTIGGEIKSSCFIVHVAI